MSTRRVRNLSRAEAERVNRKRRRVFAALASRARLSYAQSKLHIGPLSPGCRTCGDGSWSCIFINWLCTARCFYCPQNRRVKREQGPQAERIPFDRPADYTAYLDEFGFKGVGISGGEPFVVYPKVLEYTRRIKKIFGKKMYLWVYSNGDLVTEARLKELRDAGLDEIRFDISARDYDLAPVRLATRIIKTVTVEIPIIPEDLSIVKDSLPRMRDIGVKHLNIHQLLISKFNRENFIDRGYTFIRKPIHAVLESEMGALSLLEYSLREDIGLPINYCSQIFKDRFHLWALRERAVRFVKEEIHERTPAGYLKLTSAQGSPKRIEGLSRILMRQRRQRLWFVDEDWRELFFEPSLLDAVRADKHRTVIRYFEPCLSDFAPKDWSGEALRLGRGKMIFPITSMVAEIKIPSGMSKSEMRLRTREFESLGSGSPDIS